MKINSNEIHDVDPQILVNVNGELMYFNESARKAFKLKIKSDISDLLNLDDIKKFSMFSSKVDIITTLHHEFKYAIISSSGDALNKIIKIVFKSNIGKNDEVLKSEKNILSVVNNVSINRKISSFSLEELSYKIKNLFTNKGHYINTYIKLNETVCINESIIKSLIMCGITMMNETSPKRPVDLYVKRDMNNFIEIKITVRIDKNLELLTPQGVERVFPWTSIRIALIDKICEDNGISYNVTVTEKTLKLVYKIKEEQLAHTGMHSVSVDSLDLGVLYDILLPRENIQTSYIDNQNLFWC